MSCEAVQRARKRILKCVWSIAWKQSEAGPLSVEGRRPGVIASGGVHQAISSACAADRFQAHPSLRIAGESAQGGEAGNLPQPLDQPTPVPASIESVADFMRRVASVEIGRCIGRDHGRMQVIATLAALRTPPMIRQTNGPPA